MATTFGKLTNLTKILTAIKTRIIAATGVNEEFVYIGENEKDTLRKLGTNTYSVRILPPNISDLRLDTERFIGGGNATLAYMCDVRIDVISRLAVDQSYRDDTKLQSSDKGLIQFQSKLRWALSEHVLKEAAIDTQSILIKPIRLSTGGFAPIKNKQYMATRYVASIMWNDEVIS